jgi:hypothetical protein
VSPRDKPEVPRCPYCVSEGQFRAMRVLENERQICENCGHIVFPEDRAFWCPCQKCLDVRFSPELQQMIPKYLMSSFGVPTLRERKELEERDGEPSPRAVLIRSYRWIVALGGRGMPKAVARVTADNVALAVAASARLLSRICPVLNSRPQTLQRQPEDTDLTIPGIDC